MDGDVGHMVMDVTGASDDINIAYAFVQRAYAFEGIFEEDVDGVALHLSEAVHDMRFCFCQ